MICWQANHTVLNMSIFDSIACLVHTFSTWHCLDLSSFPMPLPRPLLSCCCCSWCWLTSKLHRVSQHLLLHVIWHHLTLIPPRWHAVQTEEPVNVAGMCRSKEKTVKLQLLWTAEVYQYMKKKIAGASCDVLMSRGCQDVNGERYYIHRKQ